MTGRRQRRLRGRPPRTRSRLPGADLRAAARAAGHGLDRPVPARRRTRSGRSPPSSGCTRSRSRTRSRRTSAPSWSATATSCSPCCGRPATSTQTSESSSASCTSSPARTSWSPSGTPSPRTWPGCGAGWRPTPELLRLGPGGGALRDPGPGRRRVRARSSRAWRTTSTRSRTSSSAATPRCPGGSTSCPARSSSSSAPPSRCSACWPACGGFDEVRGRRGAAAQPARRAGPRHPHRRAGRRRSGLLLQNILTVNATLVAQRQNEETQRSPRPASPERGGQEDLLLGGDPVRARRWSAPSTA